MAEFLDVYDANRKLVGAADRNVAHAFGLWHKTVHCWLVWDGKLVFQRRSRKLDNNGGKLYTTASGHVSAGESVEQAFLREIEQEIGITPKKPKFLEEITWVADIKKSNGQIMTDRVFVNIFWADYDGRLNDFIFKDGEVDSLVAINLDDFAEWAQNPSGREIIGTEWDGKKISDLKLTASDFVVNEGETICEKYGRIAEMIKKQ
ncbi:MAG: NUDIX domain-containing protein [Rickettsiales bacterium]|nr:NUDIX domain-containing protein [Rickettsiales bacterium]